MSKIAIIDMGTNTFHLLIAEVGTSGYTMLYRDHEPVKIGLAGINEGFITDEACNRAIAAMMRFRKTMDEYQVSRVLAFGTSALRSARNASAVTSEIKIKTGIDVSVISGDEEADLIFDGIRAALHLGQEKNLVIDIGAGSVEFIIGDANRIDWKQSFEIGGQRLLEKFQKHDPISAEEIAALDAYFETTLQPLLNALENFKPTVLVGSSGSFDTLSDIYCIRKGIYQRERRPETPLTEEAFYDIYDELIRKNKEQRMAIPGMISMRVDMIVVACCLIRFILEKHRFKRIRVSSFSLKEGVLARLARTTGPST